MGINIKFISGLILSFMVLGFFTGVTNHAITCKVVEAEANDFFPLQSDAERVAGHPIVGVS